MTETAKTPGKGEDAAAPAEGQVRCRVLPKGDALISTGEHVPTQGDQTYARGDVFNVALATAQELEQRGLVEIQ